MKRLTSLVLCLALLCAFASSALAAQEGDYVFTYAQYRPAVLELGVESSEKGKVEFCLPDQYVYLMNQNGANVLAQMMAKGILFQVTRLTMDGIDLKLKLVETRDTYSRLGMTISDLIFDVEGFEGLVGELTEEKVISFVFTSTEDIFLVYVAGMYPEVEYDNVLLAALQIMNGIEFHEEPQDAFVTFPAGRCLTAYGIGIECLPLQSGDKGAEVYAVKQRMQQLGYFSGSDFSEDYNDTMVKRVKQFQERNRLKVTGVVDEETIERIFSRDAKKK